MRHMFLEKWGSPDVKDGRCKGPVANGAWQVLKLKNNASQLEKINRGKEHTERRR